MFQPGSDPSPLPVRLTTPVVHQSHAKDMIVRFTDGNAIAQGVSHANEESLLV